MRRVIPVRPSGTAPVRVGAYRRWVLVGRRRHRAWCEWCDWYVETATRADAERTARAHARAEQDRQGAGGRPPVRAGARRRTASG